MTSATKDAAPAEGKVIQMSEEALLRLLNDHRNGAGFLPPGCERDADGVPYREVLVPTGRVREIKDDEGRVIKRQSVLRKQRRSVYLVTDPSPKGLVATAKYCKRNATEEGPDFYHPRLGWVRYGMKREVDSPENLGTGAQSFSMVYTDIEDEDTVAESSATMQGVPIEDEPPTETTAEAEAPREPVAPIGRRKDM